MSEENDTLIKAGTENQEEIQLADQQITSKSKESIIYDEGKVIITFKDSLGLTEDKQLLDRLASVKLNGSGTNDRKRQKVPEIMLRTEVFKQYFKPRELSIGPIHASDLNLFRKDLKHKLAAHFIERVVSVFLVDHVLKHFKLVSAEIKTCFDKKVIESYTDDELIRLVFLDGCAMLGFINSYMNQSLNMFDISNGKAALIQQDMFLLENQIPFKVLEALMDFSMNSKYDLYEFITLSSIVPRDLEYDLTCIENLEHILDLQRRMLLIDSLDSVNIFEKLETLICCPFFFIFFAVSVLICFAMERLKKSSDLPQYGRNIIFRSRYGRRTQSFRNVQELKTAGVKFKPTNSLRNIIFRSRFFIIGELSLPVLVVDDSTEQTLLNLVAYEMCFHTNVEDKNVENRPWVSSYVNLLDLLIDNEQDVKDLRAAGILENRLSSDIEVAQLINRIGSNCFAPPEDTYRNVNDEIQKHYRRRCAIWTAQVCNAHFSSPWTILALFAATMILGLTAVQTYYAINPKH